MVEVNDLARKSRPALNDELLIQEAGGGTSKKSRLSDLMSHSGQTTTLAMTDGVVADRYPAVEKGVPDAWRFNKAASWYNETRTTGAYLGEYANVTAAAGATGAAVGDYYYDTTSKTYQELTNVGTPASTETFRAGTAEFPASIAFVLNNRATDRLVILDAANGGMWAVAEGAASDLLNNNGTVAGASYRNGLLTLISTTGLFSFDFASSESRYWSTSAVRAYDGTWAQRNAGNGYVTVGDGVILSNAVQTVAIGDASKHYGSDEWGVPKQYVAVGTSSTNGVGVIHPNGKVYDITGQAAAVEAVGFNDHGELFAQGSAQTTLAWYDIPFRDVASSTYKRRSVVQASTASAANQPYLWGGYDALSPGYVDTRAIIGGAASPTLTTIDEDIYGTGDNDGRDSPASYIGYDSVLTEHFVSPLVDRAVTAALGMETGTTSLVEAELFTDANAASITNEADATTGWTAGSGALLTSVAETDGASNYSIDFDADGNAAGRLYVDLSTQYSLVVGQAYSLELRAKWVSGNPSAVYLAATNNGQENLVAYLDNTVTDFTTYKFQFVYAADTRYLSLKENGGANDSTARISTVSIKPATQDRSQLSTNHAKINGTITRAAYDGGDVVMHSGYADTSGANSGAYWELDYDVFATDGVLFDGWIDYTATSLAAIISNRAVDGSSNPVVDSATAGSNGSAVYVDTDSKITVSDDTGAAVTDTEISTELTTGLHHVVVILSSTDFYVYVNGELDQVTASVTLTAPAAAVTYIHPDSMALPRVGGLDRKATADYYRWKYAKERRLFDNGAKATLQGTGNVVDIAVDEARKTYTVLQTDHYTTFDQDGIVADDGAVSNTGVAIGVYDGDRVILDGANLTLTTASKVIPDYPSLPVKEKRVYEYDSLVEADPRIFGTTITNPPITSGDTVGGATLDWSGAEASDPTVADLMTTLFGDEAGSYLASLTVAGRTAGSVTIDISGTAGTARSADGSYSETLVYDPAASTSDDLVFNGASSFDGQVTDWRIRKVGVPHWVPSGYRIEAVHEDGSKVRPDTPDLTRDGAITRRFDGAQGWLSTADTWNTLSVEIVEDKS